MTASLADGLFWRQTAMGHTYSIPAWPFALLVAGLALAAYVVVDAWLEARRQGASIRYRPLAIGLLAVPFSFVSTWFMVAFFGFSTWEAERGPWGARVFADQLTGGLGVLLSAVFLAGAAMRLRSQVQTRSRLSPSILYGALLVLSLPWLHQGIRLLEPRGLPRIDGPEQAFVQTGREGSLEFKVMGEGYGTLTLEPIGPLEEKTPREQTIEVRGRGRGLTVSRPVLLKVAAERGTPLFPLRVGNTWKYVPFTAPGVHTHEGGVRPAGEERAFPDKAITFSIVREVVEPGLRLFELEQRTPDVETHTLRLVAFGGDVFVGSPDGPPLISLESAPAPAGSSPDAVACRFAPLDDQTCGCLGADRSPSTGPGPELCDYSPGSGGLQMTKALLVLGVSILTRSEELPPFLRLKQAAWTPGPPDAPAVP